MVEAGSWGGGELGWEFEGVMADMKQRITIEVHSELLEQVQAIADVKGISVSDMVSAKLQEIIPLKPNYEVARRRALARLRRGYDLGFSPASAR